jgi:hypothetical protein
LIVSDIETMALVVCEYGVGVGISREGMEGSENYCAAGLDKWLIIPVRAKVFLRGNPTRIQENNP